MLCKILIINMLDYKFKRFIFNKTLTTTDSGSGLYSLLQEFIQSTISDCTNHRKRL